MSAPNPKASRAAEARRAQWARLTRRERGMIRKLEARRAQWARLIRKLGDIDRRFTRPWWARLFDRLKRRGWEPVRVFTARQWRAHVIDRAPDDIEL